MPGFLEAVTHLPSMRRQVPCKRLSSSIFCSNSSTAKSWDDGPPGGDRRGYTLHANCLLSLSLLAAWQKIGEASLTFACHSHCAASCTDWVCYSYKHSKSIRSRLHYSQHQWTQSHLQWVWVWNTRREQAFGSSGSPTGRGWLRSATWVKQRCTYEAVDMLGNKNANATLVNGEHQKQLRAQQTGDPTA